MAPVRPLPRRRGLLLRLLVLLFAVALAVSLQAGEGSSTPVQPEATENPDSRVPVCAAPVALRHPALPSAAQPRDARSNEDSNGCSRPARSGS